MSLSIYSNSKLKSINNPGVRVQSSEFRVQSSGFRVQGSEFRVQSSGFRVQGSEFRVQSSGFRVQSSEFRVQGSGVKLLKIRICKGCSSFTVLKGNIEHGITNHEYRSRRRKRENSFFSLFFKL
jgi:hypothetical protein